MTENKELMETGGGALMVANLEEQVNTIQLAMKSLMKDKIHYGTIPGCGDKPALLKAGAEKILFMFRIAPKFEIETIDLGGGHREINVRAILHDNAGNFLGEGLGSCSTMESKYRWRNAGKPCPECGFVGGIFRGKADFGGGYYCNQGKGGCGKSFKAGTEGQKTIDNFKGGKVENPDIADQYNTVLKMSKKRALVDGTLTVTAASDVFEQDLDEYSEAELEAIREEKGKPKTAAPKTKAAPKPAPKKAPAKKAPAAKKETPPEPKQTTMNGAGDQTGEDTGPTFSFEDYKKMASENAANLAEWWVGICQQAMTDLGVKKYDLLQKYLEDVLGLKIDDGEDQ